MNPVMTMELLHLETVPRTKSTISAMTTVSICPHTDDFDGILNKDYNRSNDDVNTGWKTVSSRKNNITLKTERPLSELPIKMIIYCLLQEKINGYLCQVWQ